LNEIIIPSLLARNIKLQAHFVSSPMDSVTEHKTAITMALLGGCRYWNYPFQSEQAAFALAGSYPVPKKPRRRTLKLQSTSATTPTMASTTTKAATTASNVPPVTTDDTMLTINLTKQSTVGIWVSWIVSNTSSLTLSTPIDVVVVS
jgi:IMP dehydrogenase/GMP reductase